MTIFKIAVILTILLSYLFPAAAADSKSDDLASLQMAGQFSAGMTAPKAKDQELAAKHAEFDRFAKNKVKEFDCNLRFTKDRMQITKLDDGSFLARYHKIEQTSLDSSIRRSQAKTSPFVGIISYQEQVFEAHGNSLEECRNADFSLVQITPNRHIFSYSKGDWR